MLWPILKEKARDYGLPLSSVAAEVLHLIVLDAIFATSESQSLCFQGGTSIHLLYGGYRYSEDLDLAGQAITPQFVRQLIKKSRAVIEKNVIQWLGDGQTEWHFPSFSKEQPIYPVWFKFIPKTKKQKFRLKIELAGYPVYRPQVMPIRSDLDIMQRRPLVTGLTLEELLAEKITALAGRPYLKGRDFFDIWYLTKILNTSPDIALIEKKFQDYRVSFLPSDFEKKLNNYQTRKLTAEMDRFLPLRYRRQLRSGDYEEIRKSAVQIVHAALEILSASRSS